MASRAIQGGAKLEAHLKAIARKLKSTGGVKVGFLEGSTYPNGLPVAQVALWDEFGTATSPERPFFRSTVVKRSDEWGKDFVMVLKHTKFNLPQALAIMGERIKDQIVHSIATWPADNAPSTVEKKGFNKGLIDTGVMQRAVDYEVEK